MVSFICNICGAHNAVEHFVTEPASCGCGSNVRVRALVYQLSMELFGQTVPLPDFPKLRSIRGLGMTDKEGYASILADKFDYTNTHYDRDPRFDFTERHPDLYGSYDFILSSDVIEHIARPIERALEETCLLLKPRGFLALTIFCNPQDNMREHFPDLHEYRVVSLGASQVLINRRHDGTLEIRDDLVFHGGSGATLEMREFGITALKQKLCAAGFLDFEFLTENVPEIGVIFDHDVSQPLIARKQRFAGDLPAWTDLVRMWRLADAEASDGRRLIERQSAQIRLGSESRWLRLGRKLGIGPDFEA
jgi:hypothetical protein